MFQDAIEKRMNTRKSFRNRFTKLRETLVQLSEATTELTQMCMLNIKLKVSDYLLIRFIA